MNDCPPRDERDALRMIFEGPDPARWHDRLLHAWYRVVAAVRRRLPR